MSYNTQKKIDEVCEYRGLPAVKKGMRCEVAGKQGQVVGGNSSANFNVKFDGEKHPMNCHPYWKMKIFKADGSIFYQHEESSH
jgi:hypothetical protein